MKNFSFTPLYVLFLVLLSCPCLLGQKAGPADISARIRERMPDAIREHRAFVGIPNDANYPEDMGKNVAWLEKAFRKRDFEVEVLPTATIPLILAQRVVDTERPTVLFYLHFDGQPVDPSRWSQSGPFQPVLKRKDGRGGWEAIPYEEANAHFDPEWRVFARASADDKGPIIMLLQALDILESLQIQPAINIKVLLDGEEEKSSAGLLSTLELYRGKYAADNLIIMDGPAHPSNEPTLTFGCRGIATVTLTVYGPETAQHSGHFGNYAPNPVFQMAHLLSSMKAENGKVLIPGFYDGIELDEATQKLLSAVPDDEAAIRAQIGIAEPEKVGRNYQESLQFPSLNVRGMASAWTGQQVRTIVPDKAVAEIDIRLVPETDGARQLELLRKHIEGQGFYVLDREPTHEERLSYPRIAAFTAGGYVNAFRTGVDSPTGRWLSGAIRAACGKEPVCIRIMGGTVPVTPLIETLNVPAVIVPLVNMDNNQHSPNENLRLGNLYEGIRVCVGILVGAQDQ